MLEIDCAGERLQLLPEKAVFWPRAKMLVIADLHLGKPAAFRQHGVAVPENTTADDLTRLQKCLEQSRAERLMILGDFFHATAGLQPEMLDVVAAWRKKHSSLEIILTTGNHDRRSGAPPENWNIKTGESFSDLPFHFQHEPAEVPGKYVVAGHIHPAIFISEKFGSGIRAPCFLFGSHGAILPAFGSFTGMRNIIRRANDRVFAIGQGEVIELAPHTIRTAKTRRIKPKRENKL